MSMVVLTYLLLTAQSEECPFTANGYNGLELLFRNEDVKSNKK